MLYRDFGKTGIKLSIIGFGAIIVTAENQDDSDNYVAEAIDGGINYFDVAPGYGDAQDHLGPALQPYRKNVFLACKTGEWSYDNAEKQMHESFKKLRTDYFDVYQFHGVSSLEAVEKIFAPKGAMELFLKAKKEGMARYIGFSAHSEEAALAMFDNYDFDSVLFPVNWASMLKNGFGNRIMSKAIEKGAARLALKAMAEAHWPKDLPQKDRKYQKCWYSPIDEEQLASLALRFTLSQPITAAIPPGDIRLFRTALKIVENITPVTEVEVEGLRKRAEALDTIFPTI